MLQRLLYSRTCAYADIKKNPMMKRDDDPSATIFVISVSWWTNVQLYLYNIIALSSWVVCIKNRCCISNMFAR